MGLIINESDFVGDYKVATNSYTDLASYITKYEERYLRELLGATLFNLFKADKENPSQDLIYVAIEDEFAEDNSNDSIIEWRPNIESLIVSEGMKVMLLGFIYWEYTRKSTIKPTVAGIVVGDPSNSTNASLENSALYDRYNNSVRTYQAIQWFIMENEDDYPDFNGQSKRIAHWSV